MRGLLGIEAEVAADTACAAAWWSIPRGAAVCSVERSRSLEDDFAVCGGNVEQILMISARSIPVSSLNLPMSDWKRLVERVKATIRWKHHSVKVYGANVLELS